MKRRMVGAGAISLAVALTLPAAATSGEPQLRAGTMQAGGQISVDIARVKRTAKAGGVVLNVAPSFGYFISDGLELRAELTFVMEWGKIHPDAPTTIAAAVGARYFPVLAARLRPYVGLAVGPSLLRHEGGDVLTSLAISAPLGVLVPVGEGVAIDFGARAAYLRNTSDGAGTSLRISLGYLGIQGFFD